MTTLAAHPGLILLRFTWRDSHAPEEFLGRLRQALDRADVPVHPDR